jgi:hypothetical protein
MLRMAGQPPFLWPASRLSKFLLYLLFALHSPVPPTSTLLCQVLLAPAAIAVSVLLSTARLFNQRSYAVNQDPPVRTA